MYSSLQWIPHGKCDPNPQRSQNKEIPEMKNELEKDQYITGELDESDDEEDFSILPTDCYLASITMEEENFILEFHIYDTETGHFYVHHDIQLNMMPIQMQYADYLTSSGNFICVTGFSEAIEFWNIDEIDVIQPAASLPSLHESEIMSMSWNSKVKNLLLTGGADCKVVLHDLNSSTPLPDLDKFSNKIQSIEWNPVTPAVYALTGGSELEVRDGRSNNSVAKYTLMAPSESLLWYETNPNFVLTSLEDGSIMFYDLRNTTAPIWNVKAHNSACTSLSLKGSKLISTSTDKTSKIWSLDSSKPKLFAQKKMEIGAIFCSSIEDQYDVIAVGGEEKLAIWDLRNK